MAWFNQDTDIEFIVPVLRLDNDIIEDASVRVALPFQVLENASLQIAAAGEVATDASVRIV